MITRPLALLDRLRPPPRVYDALFYVNLLLLGLFFALFGSRFVLSPGVQLENPEFQLPRTTVAGEGAARTVLVIDLPRGGVAITAEGQLTYQRLAGWLQQRGKELQGGRVLVRADATTVPMQDLLAVFEMIQAAGFEVQLAADTGGLRRGGGSR